MLDTLNPPVSDPLFGIISQYQADPRPGKLDLVVGVYRDESGVTPTLEAVKKAERELAAEGASKAYRGLSGNLAFNDGIARILLGNSTNLLSRQATLQTIGGTGALRVLAEFIATASPGATVWSSNPGYVNHRPIVESAGLTMRTYRWQLTNGKFDIQAFLDDLSNAHTGDVVLVHGCCHNPSGIDLTNEDWKVLSDFCAKHGLVPWIDMAYQGLSKGLNEDATGLRHMAEINETVLIASSCSKNMGLYCERTGAACILSKNTTALPHVTGTLQNIVRPLYSMPADHGAAIAVKLFADPRQWHKELATMRTRIRHLRDALALELEHLEAPTTLLDVRLHNGMFSTLPLTPEAMLQLRSEFGIYGSDSGRINVAGLTKAQIPYLANALTTVSKSKS